jgi:hypothetical protein
MLLLDFGAILGPDGLGLFEEGGGGEGQIIKLECCSVMSIGLL